MKQIQTKLFTVIMTSFMFSLFSCAQKPGPLGERTIELDDFNFTTPISEIFPERYIHPAYGPNWYNVPSGHLYNKETLHDSSTGEALWITYTHSSSSSDDEYLSMAGQTFNAANFATTLDGHIFLVSGKIDELTQTESNDFITRLTKCYGDPIHTVEDCFGDYDLYTWTLKERTLKYAVVTTDNHNVLKIEVKHNEDGSLVNIGEGKRKITLKGYFYVIDAAWRDRFFEADCRKEGDFCYCH